MLHGARSDPRPSALAPSAGIAGQKNDKDFERTGNITKVATELANVLNLNDVGAHKAYDLHFPTLSWVEQWKWVLPIKMKPL